MSNQKHTQTAESIVKEIKHKTRRKYRYEGLAPLQPNRKYFISEARSTIRKHRERLKGITGQLTLKNRRKKYLIEKIIINNNF